MSADDRAGGCAVRLLELRKGEALYYMMGQRLLLNRVSQFVREQ